MFSIVIPLYNKANFIKKTIDSVLNQTFQRFEIIVVDDGSTDNSYSVVEGILDERIMLHSKTNGGVSSARNFGITMAKYDYIAFLDADDLWLPGYLQAQYNLIIKYPIASLFSTAFKFQHNNNVQNTYINLNLKQRNFDETVLVDNYCKAILQREIFCWTSTVCLHRKLIDKIGGFREDVNIGEDIDFWLRAGLMCKIAFSYQVLAVHIEETENNLMRSNFALKDVFPYWEWYDYHTSSPVWLYRYINSILLWKCQGLIKKSLFSDARIVLGRIRFRTLSCRLLFKYIYLKYKVYVSYSRRIK